MADPKDIKKSVEDTVNQILSAETVAANGGQTQVIVDPTAAAAQVAKAAGDFPTKEGEITSGSPEAVSANGGHDKFKNGTPNSKEEEMYGEKKKAVDAAKKALADAEAELEKAAYSMNAKKDDKDADDKKKKEAEEMAKRYPQPPKGKMKKSIEELSQHLDEDELELVKTWREECDKDAQIAKSQEAAAAAAPAPVANIEEVLKKAVAEGTADLRKALDEKDTLIKGLSDKIEKMASQPAYDRRSISTLETLEKGGVSDPTELKKSQVLDKMLELQAAGKGVTSHHVAEFEATNNISDPTVRGIVFRELKLN